jgi:hypothetical protein
MHRPLRIQCLFTELTQHAYASKDPVLRALVGGHFDCHHEVGGMASGGQHTFALSCAVHRTVVLRVLSQLI